MAAVTRSASASPCVPAHSAVDPSLFPLKSIADVVTFFRRALEQSTAHGAEPDLTLLSIVAGYLEISLTTGDAAQAAVDHGTSSASIVVGNVAAASNGDVIMGNNVPFPVVTHELVAGLYKKFESILSAVEKPKSPRQATREVIKKVSDIIWHSLIRSSHKDRAHMQNLYSYLTSNKLDCFGVALAVVAGCQLLGYRDVHLAISEDHAWVVFGNKRQETIEVTWHGKGSEDKRGQDITPGVESGSWLYLNGFAVVCNRYMEVASIVSAINISLNSNSDCMEIAELQQKLLWLLYDLGHLKRYPMAIGALGELEEINSTHKHISCEQLYREAILSAQEHYQNHHVYPYTYQGNYYNRLLKYREAFASWANAADVIRLYTYSCRDDEEIYKELLDIANEMIPFVMKTESSGHSARRILRDSEVFANLLRFYDGICQWEEDSLTPILHIGWAKPLVNNITKFDYDIRSQVVIRLPEDRRISSASKDADTTGGEKRLENNEAKKEQNAQNNNQVEGNNNLVKKEEKFSEPKKAEIPTTLADLTAACGEKILNPDFLLQGGGQPFADQKQQQQQQKIKNHINQKDEANGTDKCSDPPAQAVQHAGEQPADTITPHKEAEHTPLTTSQALQSSNINIPTPEEDPLEFMLKRPVITLYSQKMKGLKDLLLAEKLNTHAISLQVTAQSVASRKVRGIDKMGNHTSNSTYATVNVIAAQQMHYQHQQHHTNVGDTTSALAETSLAATRPKRTRRE